CRIAFAMHCSAAWLDYPASLRDHGKEFVRLPAHVSCRVGAVVPSPVARQPLPPSPLLPIGNELGCAMALARLGPPRPPDTPFMAQPLRPARRWERDAAHWEGRMIALRRTPRRG